MFIGKYVNIYRDMVAWKYFLASVFIYFFNITSCNTIFYAQYDKSKSKHEPEDILFGISETLAYTKIT